MWIALASIGFLAALIVIALLLPVQIIIKNDDNDPLILRCKYLFMTFGGDKDTDSPVSKAIKGLFKPDKKKKNTGADGQKGSIKETVTDGYATLVDYLKHVVKLLGHVTVKRLQVQILCAGSDAAEAAIHYGQCCAATYSLLHVLAGFLKVRKRGCKIDIRCDHFGGKSKFQYDVILSVRAGSAVAALWKLVLAEIKRAKAKQEKNQWK